MIVSWETLAYQPYFSWTASNVGFGFWSHDTLGPEAGSKNYNLSVFSSNSCVALALSMTLSPLGTHVGFNGVPGVV